jgi:hypothetical protein
MPVSLMIAGNCSDTPWTVTISVTAPKIWYSHTRTFRFPSTAGNSQTGQPQTAICLEHALFLYQEKEEAYGNPKTTVF